MVHIVIYFYSIIKLTSVIVYLYIAFTLMSSCNLNVMKIPKKSIATEKGFFIQSIFISHKPVDIMQCVKVI